MIYDGFIIIRGGHDGDNSDDKDTDYVGTHRK